MVRGINATQTDDVPFGRFVSSHFNITNHRNPMDVFGIGSDTVHRPEYPLIPTWALMVYLIVVNGTGVLLNLTICIGYLMQKHKIGVFTLVLHMALSDLLTLIVVSIPEMWSQHLGNWTFGNSICLTYMGLEVFAGTSCVYFLIAMNLHALASSNSIQRTGKKDSEQQLLEEVAEIKSSKNNLTSTPNSDSVISNGNPSIPVLLPIIFIWILSASLSIPEFPLSTVVEYKSDISICTLINSPHLTCMRILLSIFQLFIPLIILSSTSALIIYKLYSSKDANESYRSLKLSIFLCILFLLFSMPRFSFITYHNLWSHYQEKNGDLNKYKSPPLYDPITPITVPFILSFLHFLTPIIKPIAYVYFLLGKKKTAGNRRRHLCDAETS